MIQPNHTFQPDSYMGQNKDCCKFQSCGLSKEAHESPAPLLSGGDTYLATLKNVEGLERTQQIFGVNLIVVSNWCEKIKKNYPNGIVELYMIRKDLLRVF